MSHTDKYNFRRSSVTPSLCSLDRRCRTGRASLLVRAAGESVGRPHRPDSRRIECPRCVAAPIGDGSICSDASDGEGVATGEGGVHECRRRRRGCGRDPAGVGTSEPSGRRAAAGPGGDRTGRCGCRRRRLLRGAGRASRAVVRRGVGEQPRVAFHSGPGRSRASCSDPTLTHEDHRSHKRHPRPAARTRRSRVSEGGLEPPPTCVD